MVARNNAAVKPPKLQTNFMPAVLNVAANTTAYLDLPLGVRYHQLLLAYGGTFTPALMTQIRVKVNNQPIWAVPGTFVDTMNQFDKLPAASTNTCLVLNFERVNLWSGPARWSTAINAGGMPTQQCPSGVQSLRLEVDIGAATSPTLAVYAKVSQMNPAQATWMMRREQWFENVASSASEYLFTHKYNADPLRPVLSRLLINDTGIVTNFRMLANSQELVNRTVGVNNQTLQVDGIRTPQTNWTVYDTGESGNAANAINVGAIADFQVRATFSGTNANLPVYSETLGSVP